MQTLALVCLIPPPIPRASLLVGSHGHIRIPEYLIYYKKLYYFLLYILYLNIFY